VVLPKIDARPVPSHQAVEWLLTLQGLTYDQRKQYVADLRRQPYYRDSNQFAELVDFLEGMNERGTFA